MDVSNTIHRTTTVGFVIVLCLILSNCGARKEANPLCSTPVLYDSPLVGRWVVTGGHAEIGGAVIDPGFVGKIGNHWEYTAAGKVIREPGKDGQYRLIRPGVLIECFDGRAGNETPYRIHGDQLEMRMEDTVTAVFSFRRDDRWLPDSPAPKGVH